jgi:protein-tyrosine phosphatase
MNILNYISSGAKVLYDRTADFLSYYMMSDNDLDENTNHNKTVKKRIFTPKSKLEQIQTFFSEPTHIIDNIYLGSAFNASNYNSLINNDIGLIINMTNEISNYYDTEIIYKKYGLYDNNAQPIKHFFESAYDDILDYQNKNPNKNILIHCFMGASRSASILVYYIHKKHNKNINDCIIFIKNKRSIVNPTVLFYNQLLEVENNI